MASYNNIQSQLEPRYIYRQYMEELIDEWSDIDIIYKARGIGT